MTRIVQRQNVSEVRRLFIDRLFGGQVNSTYPLDSSDNRGMVWDLQEGSALSESTENLTEHLRRVKRRVPLPLTPFCEHRLSLSSPPLE